MKLNETIIKGKWLVIKGDLQRTWGNLPTKKMKQFLHSKTN